MAINQSELRAAVEAVLLVAGEPITINSLIEVFGEKEKDGIEACLEELIKAYAESSGGFSLEKAAGGYRFVTRPEYDVYLKKFFSKQGEGRLSIAALETLAIVAYKQPITAPEIADIRGVNSSGVLRTLLDRKLIRIAGRKNVVGSPFLYKTTKDFLLHFGLNSIQDLPRLEEFAEILGEGLADELLGEDGAVVTVDEIAGDAPAEDTSVSGTPEQAPGAGADRLPDSSIEPSSTNGGEPGEDEAAETENVEHDDESDDEDDDDASGEKSEVE
jgi:segregation and condensation protein B